MTVSFARWLYDYVGEPWNWTDRNVFDDDRWETTISAPGYRHITCVVGGVPVGRTANTNCKGRVSRSPTSDSVSTSTVTASVAGSSPRHSTTGSRSRVWSECGFTPAHSTASCSNELRGPWHAGVRHRGRVEDAPLTRPDRRRLRAAATQDCAETTGRRSTRVRCRRQDRPDRRAPRRSGERS